MGVAPPTRGAPHAEPRICTRLKRPGHETNLFSHVSHCAVIWGVRTEHQQAFIFSHGEHGLHCIKMFPQHFIREDVSSAQLTLPSCAACFCSPAPPTLSPPPPPHVGWLASRPPHPQSTLFPQGAFGPSWALKPDQ